MQASDISRIIHNEVSALGRPLKSCVKLERCLVFPHRMNFVGHAEDETWQLWIVLEEQPETKSGYKIVFDEESSQFGLATSARNVLIGFYGTFVETLEAM